MDEVKVYGKEVCKETFELNEPVVMVKKPNPVYFLRQETGFSVETNEGWMTGKAGDWLAHDPISGHYWPVAADYVKVHYEELTA